MAQPTERESRFSQLTMRAPLDQFVQRIHLLLSPGRRVALPPSEPEIPDIEECIQDILCSSFDAERDAFHERDIEIMVEDNPDRQRLLYYPAVRAYTEIQDAFFAKYLPAEYSTALQLFGPSAPRWEHAVRLAAQIQTELHIGSPAQGGIIDCRAKSLFGLWEKTTHRYQDDPDEVFDAIGLRIMVKDAESARRMKERILQHYDLMPPHQHRRRNVLHQPLFDSLAAPNERGYAAIRMNLVDSQIGAFELQIQTLEDYKVWRVREREAFNTLAASPKYGLVIDPE